MMLCRGLIVWLILIAAEIIHGIMRSALLVPLIGDFRSRQVGVFTGGMIILVIAWMTRRWLRATRLLDQLLVGAIWVLLTVVFEFVLGRWVMGLSWQRLAADYDLLQGGLMPIGLAIMFASPALVEWTGAWASKRQGSAKQ